MAVCLGVNGKQFGNASSNNELSLLAPTILQRIIYGSALNLSSLFRWLESALFGDMVPVVITVAIFTPTSLVGELFEPPGNNRLFWKK